MRVRRLTYHVSTTRTPALEADARELGEPTTESATVIVELSETWHSHREGPNERIVDAQQGTIYRIDHDARTLGTSTIHAEVAFREAEIANRMMILQVMQAGGAEVSTRADQEASLGMEAHPPEAPGPEAQDQAQAQHEPSTHAVSPHVLRRWLGFEVMLHPRASARIANEGMAPAHLHHRVRLVPELYERTWTLASAEDVEVDGQARLQGLHPAAPTDALHGRVRAMLANPPRDLPSRLEQGRAAMADGRHLEALLSFVAHSIATTDTCASDVRALNEKLSKRELATKFMAALQSLEQGQQVDRALKVYDKAEKKAGPVAHIVGLLRANAMTGLAAREQDAERRAALVGRAREGFVRAIEADPGLAGVYKDLGDLYLSNYETTAAWDLWTLGRLLAPGHKIFTNVEAYEQHLQQAHPELYGPA
ncbi:MAG: hypothetical protein AB1Z98_08510 [Nannocystaceae bacterium]